MEEKISVVVTGAAGKMGREVVKAIRSESDLQLVAAVGRDQEGKDAGTIAGIGPINLPITSFLESSLQEKKPKVMIDFTRHDAALGNIETSLRHHVACVVGTTGFTSEDFRTIQKWCEETKTPALIAPNFAIGAVLLMKFAKEASKYFSRSEIIELHEEGKLDAPSGTAMRTAHLMLSERSHFERKKGSEMIPGVRGGEMQGIGLHSIRLPGLVAHQEVLFGGNGQILTLRHDSLSRESFMPGVLLAVRKVLSFQGLVIGLENVFA